MLQHETIGGKSTTTNINVKEIKIYINVWAWEVCWKNGKVQSEINERIGKNL
jgi:hypothetical protein